MLKKALISIIVLLFVICSPIIHAKKEEKPTPPPVKTIHLQIVEQKLPINGKATNVFNLIQPDGTFGFVGQKGQVFDAIVENKTHEWVAIHWHGLIVPNNMDGVPFVTQQPIAPGASYHYRFELFQTGTFWVHSHYRLQTQKLLAAPFIVLDPTKASAAIDVPMFLQDFTFGDPKQIYPQLRRAFLEKQANIQVAATPEEQASNTPKQVAMDAYLTNRRTLMDPQIVRVQPGSTIRLRVINAAANSNFFVNLGSLQGILTEVDSEPIEPMIGSRFQIAQGQRLVIEITLPSGDNFYPIVAQAEGTNKLTGLVLASPNAIVPKFNATASDLAPMLDYRQEEQLVGKFPLLTHDTNHSYNLNFDGNLVSYVWTANGQVWPNVKPLPIKQEDRVEVVLNNKSLLALPVHLHGHVFQITEINGKKIRGAMRDTVLVLPNSIVKIAFDADNPGIWLLRGFIPFQTYGGLITPLVYDNYSVPVFRHKDTGLPPTSMMDTN